MPQKGFSLANFQDILVDHQKEYSSVRGAKREKLLDGIIESITSDPLYNFKGSTDDLKKVSLGFLIGIQ